MNTEALKKRACQKALAWVREGMVVGLGTGSTVRYFIKSLAERARAGLAVEGVPTSRATRALAEKLGLSLVDPSSVSRIDLAVDGADEVDPEGRLVKGGGGALAREKIVDYRAKRFVVVVDEGKRVARLGAFGVPVEVLAFGWKWAARELEALGGRAALRQGFVSDNGNPVLDWRGAPLEDPETLEEAVNAVPGVVENGLFARCSATVLVAGAHGVGVLERRRR